MSRQQAVVTVGSRVDKVIGGGMPGALITRSDLSTGANAPGSGVDRAI